MDRLPALSANELIARTREQFERLMREVAAAVNASPEGRVINGSEEQVRDLLGEFRREVYQTAALDRILGSLGRALKGRRRLGLVDRRFHAAELGFVAALQVQQMSAVVHNGDDDAPSVLEGLRFGCRGNVFGNFKGQNGFLGQRHFFSSAANISSRIFSTLPTPTIFTHTGALRSPEFCQVV